MHKDNQSDHDRKSISKSVGKTKTSLKIKKGKKNGLLSKIKRRSALSRSSESQRSKKSFKTSVSKQKSTKSYKTFHTKNEFKKFEESMNRDQLIVYTYTHKGKLK